MPQINRAEQAIHSRDGDLGANVVAARRALVDEATCTHCRQVATRAYSLLCDADKPHAPISYRAGWRVELDSSSFAQTRDTHHALANPCIIERDTAISPEQNKSPV